MMIHNMCPKPLFRAKHIIALTLVISVPVTLYVSLSMRGYASYTGRNPLQPARCQYFSKTQGEKFLNLTYKVHKILEQLGIDHWLMYGSVFGAIRVQGPLPWDYDVDIGLNGSEWIASMNLDQFVSAFESQGLKVNQKSWTSLRLLKITTDDLPLYEVDLFVLNNYRGWMERAGWESWLFWLHYRFYHKFPTRLIIKPLPRVPFGFFKMPVPRGGIEIQRYLYPDDWWKEVKPVACV